MSERERELLASRKEHLKALRTRGIDPYPYSYRPTHTARDVRDEHDTSLKAGEHTDIRVRIAGRIMSERSFGKLHFLVVEDETGSIQIVASQQETPEDSFQLVEFLDAGDIIGISGRVMKTKKGELSVLAEEITVLTKALKPLPDKWHGLSDVEIRYRKRYLDLIANPQVRRVFEQRAQIIREMRRFLEDEGFLEVETPLLQPTYGGANARPFTTEAYAWKTQLYLSISPELYLKRLLIGGYPRVYTICKNFRNEDVDASHNPEFTMMECYAAYWDYEDVMDFTERLIEHIAQTVFATTQFTYKGESFDCKAPWKRMTMREALIEYAGFDPETLSDAQLKKHLKDAGIDLDYKRGLAIQELFEHHCEEKLIGPVFITDHPKETTPLCKPKRGNHDLIERFEGYIMGGEIANAYSELNDPELQEQFFVEQAEQGQEKGENHPRDDAFLEALRYGMPPAGGLGIGVDRLVMLLTGQTSIKDVIFFPQLRPKT